jgi:hypothetical protein
MSINSLKTIKILDKFTQRVILTNNENYVMKIYTKKSKRLKMLIRILYFFINYNKLPKTIHKSYYVRYISNIKLSKKYNFTPKVFEIMKKYDITLNKFIDNN